MTRSGSRKQLDWTGRGARLLGHFEERADLGPWLDAGRIIISRNAKSKGFLNAKSKGFLNAPKQRVSDGAASEGQIIFSCAFVWGCSCGKLKFFFSWRPASMHYSSGSNVHLLTTKFHISYSGSLGWYSKRTHSFSALAESLHSLSPRKLPAGSTE
jgi:hypothetical protein